MGAIQQLLLATSLVSPADIPGLVEWWQGESGRYDATSGGSLVTVNGNPVPGWQGVVNSLRCTQASGTNTLIKSDNDIVGQYGGAVIGGNDSFMDLPSISINQQSFSIFFICEMNNLREGLTASGATPAYKTFFENGVLNLLYSPSTGIFEGYGWLGGGAIAGSFVPTSRALVGVTSGASASNLIINNSSFAKAAATAGTTSGGRILGYGGFNLTLQATVQDVIIYDHKLTAGELVILSDYATSRGCVFFDAATSSNVFSGDSITAGATNARNLNFPKQATYPANALRWNNSKSGISMATLYSERATRDYPLFQTGIRNNFFNTSGINDILIGTSAASLLITAKAYGTDIKSAGYIKFIATTLMGTTFATGVVEINRVSYNSLVSALFGIGVVPAEFDGIMDIASDPTVGNDPTNLTYFADGIHPTNAGSAILAKYVAPFGAATGFTISGPSTCTVGVASGAFTLTIANGGEFRGQMAIRLASNNGTLTVTSPGATISGNGTATVTVTPAVGQTALTYTCTAASAGAVAVTSANGQGWTNASPPTLTAS